VVVVPGAVWRWVCGWRLISSGTEGLSLHTYINWCSNLTGAFRSTCLNAIARPDNCGRIVRLRWNESVVVCLPGTAEWLTKFNKISPPRLSAFRSDATSSSCALHLPLRSRRGSLYAYYHNYIDMLLPCLSNPSGSSTSLQKFGRRYIP
jgi:hypothetical protein